MLLFEKSNQKDLAVGNRFEGKRYPSIGAAIKDLFCKKAPQKTSLALRHSTVRLSVTHSAVR